MITADQLTLGYGGVAVVRGLNLRVAAGQVVALVGGDAAGKTTIVRALAGRLRPLEGPLDLPDRARIGVMPAVGAVFADLTVVENLEFASAAHGLGRGSHEEVLTRMGLTQAADRLAGRLSGGMRQKLGLAMALSHRPRLLLLDEPTTGVDPVSRAEIWRLLSEQVSAGTTVVLATTYLDEAARAALVVVLDDGAVIQQGTPAAICRHTPGVILSGGAPVTSQAWRRGRSWHSWQPDRGADTRTIVDGHKVTVIPADLEDAVIVAALHHHGVVT